MFRAAQRNDVLAAECLTAFAHGGETKKEKAYARAGARLLADGLSDLKVVRRVAEAFVK